MFPYQLQDTQLRLVCSSTPTPAAGAGSDAVQHRGRRGGCFEPCRANGGRCQQRGLCWHKDSPSAEATQGFPSPGQLLLIAASSAARGEQGPGCPHGESPCPGVVSHHPTSILTEPAGTAMTSCAIQATRLPGTPARLGWSRPWRGAACRDLKFAPD